MNETAWRQLNALRQDVREGTLALAEFAADLNAVRTGGAPAVYRVPEEFFARTYPTYNMKVLARDVLQRLAGVGGKPVIRIQVAYGGGKTHSLIALLHLAEHGSELAADPGVREFLGFAGLHEAPRARVALLPFDKFDVKEGLIARGPDGRERRVMTPWGALAYQMAGEAGFARVAEHERDYVAPAEPILVDLLRAPQADGLASLVLMDETVWYYRGAVNADARRLGLLKDFFQVLVQAVGKVQRASLVASLIASEVEANDLTGSQCMQALQDVFSRVEEVTEPVTRDDVAEVLRRRLFETVAGENQRRPVIDTLMAGMQSLPLRDAQKDQDAYNRLLASYPFHPELIEALYGKWTQLPGFQRTRGALRLLAQALREADGVDPSPMIGPCALLARDGGLSPGLLEMVKVCQEREAWTPILQSELAKAREVQQAFPSLREREIEQAVLATFLHSQPAGQKAETAELYGLLAHPEMDSAALSEALKKYRDLSWFLVEDPSIWRLATTPNLTHMHGRAMERVTGQINAELERMIRSVGDLAQADVGVESHRLPQSPDDINDDPQLHYLVLGPGCAVEPGRPVPREVADYFNIKSGPSNLRTYRNSILALAPDAARLAGLRESIRRYLGWTALEKGEEQKLLNDQQRKKLASEKKEALEKLPDTVRATYSVAVAVDDEGKIEARLLPSGLAEDGTDKIRARLPFERVKRLLASEERLVTETLDPELLLPNSYLELWRAEETSKRATDLLKAFAHFPRLPRLLRPAVLYDSLLRGVREGKLVLRLGRPDGSAQTWWRSEPDRESLLRPEMDVVPPAMAELSSLSPELLVPGRLNGLWPDPKGPLDSAAVAAYFDGDRAPRLAGDPVLNEAVAGAVLHGLLMARDGDISYLREDLLEEALSGNLELLPPPAAVSGTELAPAAIPEAWQEGETTVEDVWQAVSARRGYRLPWTLVRDAVSQGLLLRTFEVTPGGSVWPVGSSAAAAVRLRPPSGPPPEPVVYEMDPAALVQKAEAVASNGKAALRMVKEALEVAVGHVIAEDVFLQGAQSVLNRRLLVPVDAGGATITLDTFVRLPSVALCAEAQLSSKEIQDFAGLPQQLKLAAPELAFTFRVSISAEGAQPASEVVEALNQVLAQVSTKWRFE